MRCKACDKPLEFSPTKASEADIIEDLCSTCRSSAMSEYNYVYDHEFMEDVPDGLQPPKDFEDY